MSGLVERLLNVAPLYVFLVVGLLVFVEDALFVGFVVPGETAAVVGGVYASRGEASVVWMCVVVVVAAIVGDSVGYEVGKTFGPRLLALKILDKRRDKLDGAQDFLARRGGSAVFLGRFVSFFRAVMPALAGTAKMPYRRFLPWNAAGGLVWGTAFVLLGFFAGNSYQAVASKVGTGLAVAVAVVVVVAVVVWRVRRERA
ncbi:DedA family protein [Rhodococcus antarcticus]|jgi:membrane-associated protein|uniref:DedA family protein n=1 Tax=Rhodococcus antarcticus TaxID=2987751 RepID=A0ABY6P2C4_9NOCA|nr:DedA family protein [Rhodococcus antarcticus]UZJ25654.1 DedA family protein [Rhodococcus antarcticus]